MCQPTKWRTLNKIPSISKFILQRDFFVYSMNEYKLRGVRYPNPQPFESLCGAFTGGHMIALHDCFLRDLHLWSSALKPTCYCYFTGHDKDKGPADRDTNSHCNGIWLGNSLISMLLNVIFELHGWPQYLLYMNTTYQYLLGLWTKDKNLLCIRKTLGCFSFSFLIIISRKTSILWTDLGNASNACLRQKSVHG